MQVTAMDVALKIADAVNYNMHSHVPMITHQDFEPQNILASLS